MTQIGRGEGREPKCEFRVYEYICITTRRRQQIILMFEVVCVADLVM
jgi:hypothetical protein